MLFIFGKFNYLLLIEFIISLTCIGYSIPNLYSFYVMQFFSGLLAASNVTVSVLILTEFFPKTVSGRTGPLLYVSITGMILLSYTINFIFPSDDQVVDNYIPIFGWIIIISLVRSLLIITIYCGKETPVQIVKNSTNIENKESKSRKKLCWVLSTVYQKDQVELIAHDLIESRKEELKGSPKISFWQLFSSRYRLAFIISCTLNMMQHFTGINFLVFYAKTFFDEVNNNGDEMNIVLGIANVFGGFTCIYMIARFGRRFNLKQSALNLCISMFSLAVGVQFKMTLLCSFSVIIFMISFAFGLGGSMAIYSSEITHASGLGYAVSIQWISAAIIGKFVPIVLNL